MSKIGLLHPDVIRLADAVVNELVRRALIAQEKLAFCVQYFSTNGSATTETELLNRLNRYYENAGFPESRD